jgi:hypothetical protein
MCDDSLGLVLDAMDRYDMWKDTLLIVNTDHGFLLGEHDLYGKHSMPWYDEIANIPLFIHDPRHPEADGRRRDSLVQTIDIAPTLIEFFGGEPTADMQGQPVSPVIADDEPVREGGLFGLFGGQINVTDGRFVYMRAPVQKNNQPLYRYTLMPMHMAKMYSPEQLRDAELAPAFGFTKGTRLLRIPSADCPKENSWGTLLFDVEDDPGQQHPLTDAETESRMSELLVSLMERSDAPPEQFARLGLGTTGGENR